MTSVSEETMKKYTELEELLKGKGSLAVAFSGGVDSTFLLKAAREALGDRVLAVTVSSCFVPQREQREADEFCREQGIRHIFHRADVLGIDGIRENPKERCYICKKAIFEALKRIAAENGMTAVAEGSNVDDEGDYRPGMQAIRELGILSPLRQVRLTKREIRELSAALGLKTYAKPSFACLASRIPYGEELTAEKLHRVELAEELLKELGFTQYRVRLHETQHGSLARLELLPSEFDRVLEPAVRERILTQMKELGFRNITMDLQGYRTGSLNEGVISGH